MLRSPNKGKNCFGVAVRLRGHNRVPVPPAMINAYIYILDVPSDK
jgi:hypothetical protein